jgi:hypothetical protein
MLFKSDNYQLDLSTQTGVQRRMRVAYSLVRTPGTCTPSAGLEAEASANANAATAGIR